jgi:hypothetical protein
MYTRNRTDQPPGKFLTVPTTCKFLPACYTWIGGLAGRPQTSERSAAMPGAIARAHHWPVRAVHARKGPPKSTVSRAWGINLAGAANRAVERRRGNLALGSFLIATRRKQNIAQLVENKQSGASLTARKMAFSEEKAKPRRGTAGASGTSGTVRSHIRLGGPCSSGTKR